MSFGTRGTWHCSICCRNGRRISLQTKKHQVFSDTQFCWHIRHPYPQSGVDHLQSMIVCNPLRGKGVLLNSQYLMLISNRNVNLMRAGYFRPNGCLSSIKKKEMHFLLLDDRGKTWRYFLAFYRQIVL